MQLLGWCSHLQLSTSLPKLGKMLNSPIDIYSITSRILPEASSGSHTVNWWILDLDLALSSSASRIEFPIVSKIKNKWSLIKLLLVFHVAGYAKAGTDHLGNNISVTGRTIEKWWQTGTEFEAAEEMIAPDFSQVSQQTSQSFLYDFISPQTFVINADWYNRYCL